MLPYSYDAKSGSRAGAGECNAGYTGVMDDDTSPRPEHHEPEPCARIDDDGQLWFRDEHGQWHTHEWESTGDLELDALWAMPAREVERIANNEADPLHDKAKQVQSEAAEPMRKLLESVAHPWRDASGEPRWILPGLRLDWEKMNPWVPVARSTGSAEADLDGEPADQQSAVTELIESAQRPSDSAPEPTMAQLLGIWQATLEEHRRANEYWRQFIAATEASGKRANQNAQEANTLSADANKVARRSLWVAGVAALISVVSAVAAVVSAMQ